MSKQDKRDSKFEKAVKKDAERLWKIAQYSWPTFEREMIKVAKKYARAAQPETPRPEESK